MSEAKKSHWQNPDDRRRHARFELLDYAVVRRPSGEETLRSVVTDVSLGGLQIRSRTQFPAGEKCVILIGRGNERPITMNAEVRYSQAIEDCDLFATGFKFVPKTMGERIEWVDYVHAVFLSQGERLLY